MLKKENRLSTENLKDFHKNTKTMSCSENGTTIYLRYKLNNSEEKRFGVSCPKKICKTSVTRNRLRRIVYSTIENNMNTISCGVDGLFSIKKYSGEESIIEKIISQLLHKAGLVIDSK